MSSWVMRLLVANVAMFFVSRAAPGLVLDLALIPALVQMRPWTPFTDMFLHANAFHLLFNMMGLFFFGPRLEARIGGKRFLQLYLVRGLTGALFSIATPHVPIVGASGAIFGVFVGFARYWPRAQVLVWGIVPVEARIMVVLMTVLALMGGFGAGTGVEISIVVNAALETPHYEVTRVRTSETRNYETNRLMHWLRR